MDLVPLLRACVEAMRIISPIPDDTQRLTMIEAYQNAKDELDKYN